MPRRPRRNHAAAFKAKVALAAVRNVNDRLIFPTFDRLKFPTRDYSAAGV